jgi:endonuclease/exonuclease/phosphatase family metal-dependent hydrolase
VHVRHRLVSFVVAAGLVLGVGAATGQSAAADGDEGGKPKLTVMTQNLYLGSSLDAALDPNNDIVDFLTAVATIYSTAVFTDFPTRAQAIADEIEDEDPDLIALQEVSNWIVTQPAGNTPHLESYDFLALLTTALASRGLHYEVAAVSNNADIGPVPLVGVSSGCVVAAPVPDCTVELKDRDVILVNEDTPGLTWRNPKSGTYKAQQTFTPPAPAQPESFDRGWVSIDASIDGREFRFFNTHLEVEAFPKVQAAQALELLARVLLSRPPVIVAGDFNSAADGSTTPTYRILTTVLNDAWVAGTGPDDTCCQSPTLTNPVTALTQRIDLILWRGDLRAKEAHTVGGEVPFQSTPPFWPSDHAGVVATLQFT